MRPFDFARPRKLGDVLALLEEYGPAVSLLAGGTDLMVRLRFGQAQPRVVADLKRVEALRSDIHETGSCLRVGALAILSNIIGDQRVRRHFPALAEAAATVGSVQIRNRATLAGNLCNASPAADTAPALLAYGAMVNVAGLSGTRRVPATEFFVAPGKTVLARTEIVESIDLPLPSIPSGAAFERLSRRRGMDLATVNVCCLVTARGKVRFAFGAAGPCPFLVEDESGALVDPDCGTQRRDSILGRIVEHAKPISDVRATRDYRQAMLLVLSRRALQRASERLRTSGSAE